MMFFVELEYFLSLETIQLTLTVLVLAAPRCALVKYGKLNQGVTEEEHGYSANMIIQAK